MQAHVVIEILCLQAMEAMGKGSTGKPLVEP